MYEWHVSLERSLARIQRLVRRVEKEDECETCDSLLLYPVCQRREVSLQQERE
jgi:hypothetical protein